MQEIDLNNNDSLYFGHKQCSSEASRAATKAFLVAKLGLRPFKVMSGDISGANAEDIQDYIKKNGEAMGFLHVCSRALGCGGP